MVSIITSVFALVGVVISNIHSNNALNRSFDTKFATSQAVLETKINQLTEEVQKHNNFAMRMPVVEEQIRVINHRIDDLERKEA